MSENLFTYNELESSKEVVADKVQAKIQIFNYQGKLLDYGLLNGEPVFNLNAIANLLGIVNPRTSIDTSDKNYCIKIDISIVGFAYNRKLHNTGELFLTESGLYMLLMRSNNPNAKSFQLWVTKEVLPSIRKTGSYNVAQKLPQTYAEALRELADKVEENERLLIENADQKEIINSYKIADRTKRNKQELATLLNRKIRELADKQYNKQYHKAYLAVYEEFAKLHCFTHKVDMQFLRTNIDYLSECLKLVLDMLDKEQI